MGYIDLPQICHDAAAKLGVKGQTLELVRTGLGAEYLKSDPGPATALQGHRGSLESWIAKAAPVARTAHEAAAPAAPARTARPSGHDGLQ